MRIGNFTLSSFARLTPRAAEDSAPSEQSGDVVTLQVDRKMFGRALMVASWGAVGAATAWLATGAVNLFPPLLLLPGAGLGLLAGGCAGAALGNTIDEAYDLKKGQKANRPGPVAELAAGSGLLAGVIGGGYLAFQGMGWLSAGGGLPLATAAAVGGVLGLGLGVLADQSLTRKS